MSNHEVHNSDKTERLNVTDRGEYTERLRAYLKDKTLDRLKSMKKVSTFEPDQKIELDRLVRDSLLLVKGILDQNSIDNKRIRKKLKSLADSFSIDLINKTAYYDEPVLHETFNLFNKITAKYGGEEKLCDKARAQSLEELRQRIEAFYGLWSTGIYHCLIMRCDFRYDKRFSKFRGGKRRCIHCHRWENK